MSGSHGRSAVYDPVMAGTKAAKRKTSGETVRLRIGNLAKAVLVTGQAYQDPKDALNEFVSNAADEYAQAERRGETIRVVLRRKGRHPIVAIDDRGRGMSPDRLREVARSLFESTKAGDARTLGEKAIGMLAFQQLGSRCDVVSRAEDSTETWALRFVRGSATATLERERRRARDEPGTTMYLSDLDPDVLRLLTHRKVVDYLRARRGPALARGDYVIEVVEGRVAEVVTPEKPDGVRLDIAAKPTLWGRIDFGLYVAPPDGKHRRVAVVGRAGTTIVDDLAELDEFASQPWTSDQVSGQIVFEALQQSAGRRAILRDREAFPVFLDTIRSVEPSVNKAIERVTKEIDAQTADRLADTLRRVFGLVLKELADLDNPMRTALGSEPGVGALFVGDGAIDVFDAGTALSSPGDHRAEGTPSIDELVDAARDPVRADDRRHGTRRARPSPEQPAPECRARPGARRRAQSLRARSRCRALQRPALGLPHGERRRSRAARLSRHARRQGVRALQQSAGPRRRVRRGDAADAGKGAPPPPQAPLVHRATCAGGARRGAPRLRVSG